MKFHCRTATTDDIPRLQALIRTSGLGLSEPYYTALQAEAITRHVFGVDSQLIADKTYLAIDVHDRIGACGGWSKRRTLFGGDQTKQGLDELLDPSTEPARIRAFFVHPELARKGLASCLIDECIAQARSAGFTAMELAATLPGEPFYLAHGFDVVERSELNLPGDIAVGLTRMRRAI